MVSLGAHISRIEDLELCINLCFCRVWDGSMCRNPQTHVFPHSILCSPSTWLVSLSCRPRDPSRWSCQMMQMRFPPLLLFLGAVAPLCRSTNFLSRQLESHDHVITHKSILWSQNTHSGCNNQHPVRVTDSYRCGRSEQQWRLLTSFPQLLL